MMKSAVVLTSLALVSAQRGRCYLGGDPHVRGFDRKRVRTHHPVYAPGARWLVNTKSGDFQAQAMYTRSAGAEPPPEVGRDGRRMSVTQLIAWKVLL